MQFTYKIENYYPYEGRIFVVYMPVDTAFEPLGGWVYISADMTQEQIRAAVVLAAPLSKWTAAKSTAIDGLLGSEDSGVATPPPEPQPDPPPPEPVPPTLAETQAFKWYEIKRVRDVRTQSGVKVGTDWFHSDTFSRTQQLGLTMMGAAMPAGIMWKTMSGSFVEMTPTLAGQIFQSTAAHDSSLFATAEAKHAEMLALADPTDYDVTAGWPAAYA